MNILGITAYAHDAAAAIVSDGLLLAACEEERFSGRKHETRLPGEAVRYCLDAIGAEPGDIDGVAVFWNPHRGTGRHLSKAVTTPSAIPGLLRKGISGNPSPLKTWVGIRSLPLAVRRLLGAGHHPPVHFCDHHPAHAADAFLSSPFETAAILTLDGSGETESIVGFRGLADGSIERVFDVPFPHSLGYLYGAVTQFLGFRARHDEGTVMALAGTGDPGLPAAFESLLRIDGDGMPRLALPYFQHQRDTSGLWYSPRLCELLGPPRRPEDEITDRHRLIAASLQARMEEVILGLAERLHAETGEKNLCLAGGIALNSACNGRVLREAPFKGVFVPPSPGDSGAACGAAMLTYGLLTGRRPSAPEGAFLGSAIDRSEARKEAMRSGFSTTSIEDRGSAGRMLAAGKALIWASGRMEFGPRALGGRSILADPRPSGMQDFLNHEVKRRHSFQPFAAAVLAERQAEFFSSADPSPNMSFVHRVRPEKAAMIPAVIHADGSCRVQTVERSHPLREVLEDFTELSRVPVLLNTSLNLSGEPIARTAGDVLHILSDTPLEAAVIDDLLVKKGDGEDLTPVEGSQPGLK